jgi:hypothetical protein
MSKFVMLPHQIADCQFVDDSVRVEWQDCVQEGTEAAVIGCYTSLEEALMCNPDAQPVCPACRPQLVHNTGETLHEPSCNREGFDFTCLGVTDD